VPWYGMCGIIKKQIPYTSGSQTLLHVDPQFKNTIFCRTPRPDPTVTNTSNCYTSYYVAYCCTTSLTTAELRHMQYNIVCDETNRTVFIMSSQSMINKKLFESNVLWNYCSWDLISPLNVVWFVEKRRLHSLPD